jgi:L-seryl-tRNA(Ser) seleniumtransferase
VYRAAGAPLEELEQRGARIRESAPAELTVRILPSLAAFGGGTSPEKLFPSRALMLTHAARSAENLAAGLRAATPPIVARVEGNRVLLDLRSIQPEEDALVAAAIGRLR